MIIDGNSSRDSSQRLVHCVCQPAVDPLDSMGVSIEGDGYAGVAHELLDALRILARHKQNGSTRMSKTVKAYARQICTLG
jgi:hypothetical protein